MSAEEAWNTTTKVVSGNPQPPHVPKSGFDPQSGIYHSLDKLDEHQQIPTMPDLDTATYVLSQFPHPHQAESQIALIDSSTNQQVTYTQLQRSIRSLASDTAAILYSSGTTGTSKGVILTHANFIAVMTLLRWSVDVTSAQNDVFLCFIPTFPIYGLAFFALGLFCSGTTTVLMQKFEFQAMLHAIKAHKVSNIPAVPPVILGLVKYTSKAGFKSELSSLRRVGSGAAPLSKELGDGFRERFPWVEIRQGYGLTESCVAATFFVSDNDAKARSGSAGRLVPSFCAKVAPAELEAILLSHPTIMDAAVIPVEDDEAGQIPMAYVVIPCGFDLVLVQLYFGTVRTLASILKFQQHVVKAVGSELTEDQVIHFVASQVAPYKKVRRVSFTSAIPRSAAGNILRKDLVSQSKQQLISKL
uniref:Uncharacterized protein n=1 Tax=Quercus lobata TaxID=97700 RepID=A0A7N2MDL3_QUELO